MIRVPRYQISLVRDGSVPYGECGGIKNSADVLPIVAPFFDSTDRESLLVITVDTQKRPIGVNVVSVGTLNQSLVHPREVFKLAVMQNAYGIFLAHNHPSGNPAPSRDDDTITGRIVRAGEILGVVLVDHVIVGEAGAFYSYSDTGRLYQMKSEGGVL